MKILILTYKKYKDDDGGGEEIYIKELKTVLEENEHHVDISYIFEKDILKKTTFYRRFFLKKYFFNLEVGIFSKYDIIINNTSFIVDKNYNKNVIWVQHSNLDIYIKNSNINKLLILRNLKSFRVKTFFYLILQNISFYKSPLIFYKNIALYNNQHRNDLLPDKNIFYTYIPKINLNIKNAKKSKMLCYLGRIDNISKNIDFINKISKNMKLKIDTYGKGSDISILNKKYVSNHFLKRDQIIQLSKYKIALFPSFYEGACLSMHEMIELGVIPIVSNFSSEIDFIKNNEKLKFLCISSQNKVNDWINVISKISSFNEYEYNKIVEELQKSRRAIYFKDFGDNWLDIINNFPI